MADVERNGRRIFGARRSRELINIHWGSLCNVFTCAVLLLGSFFWWRRRPAGLQFRDELAGIGMISPWVLGFIAFTAFSVGLSLILSFAKSSSLTTLDHAQYVGWDNFRSLWTRDNTFTDSLKATAWYALLAVPTGQIAALVAAILMNHAFRSIGVFRAIWYLPSVLAGVGVAVMWKWVFHHEHGLLKLLLDRSCLRECLTHVVRRMPKPGVCRHSPSSVVGDRRDDNYLAGLKRSQDLYSGGDRRSPLAKFLRHARCSAGDFLQLYHRHHRRSRSLRRPS
jgi:ABC-type spermidine/putrescine transport system permease subunit II